jgi:methylated-DNA-[protein]-cysteine S-methyltransferase
MSGQLAQVEEIFSLATPVGQIAVYISDQQVVQLDYATRKRQTGNRLSPLAASVKKQIQSYFKSPDNSFEIPVKTAGTAFQKRVWRFLQTIPAGKTLTYGEIARHLHTSARAVGNACRSNPVPLIIPCHRVVASQGIGGFGGETAGANINRKRWLLKHEGVTSV